MYDKMNNLFSEWKARPHHQGALFITDGMINPDKWNGFPKVLFLLKEAYGPQSTESGEWDLCKLLREEWKGPKGKLFRSLAQWAFGIKQLPQSGIVPFPYDHRTNPAVREAFFASAIVNVKKSQGKSQSNLDDLRQYVESDWDLIFRQLQSLKPDLIVCGYTWTLIKDHLDHPELISDRVYRSKNLVFVDFWHPANQFPNALNYYTLCSLVQMSRILTRKTPEPIVASHAKGSV